MNFFKSFKKLFSRRRFATVYVLIILGIVLVSYAAYGKGYRVNLSPSVPRGLWKVDEVIPPKLQRDGYVTVSPEGNPGYQLALERGYLIESMPMLKRIVAAEGDFVSYDVGERSVTVNGGYIFMTEIISRDTEGRSLPSAPFPMWLKEDQVWLSSENIRGYDSRYFGPVSSDILRKATPVWVFR